MATIVPAIIAIKRRRMIEAFRTAGAVSPATARKPEDLGVDRGHMFGRMVKSGVFKELPDGGVWLDDEVQAQWERRARTIMTTMFVLVLAVACVLMLIR